MRVDVRENLERAAADEREFNNNSIVLISDTVVADMLKGWSRPVELLATRYDDSPIVEITVRETA